MGDQWQRLWARTTRFLRKEKPRPFKGRGFVVVILPVRSEAVANLEPDRDAFVVPEDTARNRSADTGIGIADIDKADTRRDLHVVLRINRRQGEARKAIGRAEVAGG